MFVMIWFIWFKVRYRIVAYLIVSYRTAWYGMQLFAAMPCSVKGCVAMTFEVLL